MLEAWHAHVPLVMITASRPRSMINTGANQTADQAQLFGRHARGYAALSDQTADPWAWRFELARLITTAAGTRTGTPARCSSNVEFSDPLVPVGFVAPTSDAASCPSPAARAPDSPPNCRQARRR